jgi:predicted amidophosphoribosyltransferase
MAISTRISREKKTVQAMILLHCKRKHHPTLELCPDCQELLNYAYKRLDQCKFGENKPVCGNCVIHCYKSEMREKIRGIMRYAGPRMLLSHPLMALQHILDKRHKPSSN